MSRMTYAVIFPELDQDWDDATNVTATSHRHAAELACEQHDRRYAEYEAERLAVVRRFGETLTKTFRVRTRTVIQYEAEEAS